ncbi:hypothetical protein EV2_039416 [Malus domestica]
MYKFSAASGLDSKGGDGEILFQVLESSFALIIPFVSLCPIDSFEKRLTSISGLQEKAVEGDCSSSQALVLLQGSWRFHL